MKFGKIPDVSAVDFSLPPLNQQSLQLLGGKPAASGFQAYVGLPRWASKEWIGQLFPKGTKATDYLRYYARSFNTIELNSTHYRSPSPEQVAKWRDMATGGFHFCPKIPQQISHYRKLVNVREELPLFTDAIAHFEDKLGPSFVQMHESFGPNLAGNLRSFLQNWPQGVPLAIEFRHPDWYEGQQLKPEWLELLTEFQVGAVITDVAGRRDVSHTSLTVPTVVMRFVGNALHPTDYSRTDAWLDRIALWVENGLEHLYLFAHEPTDPMAADLGAYWIKGLNERFGLNLALPGIPEEPGGQMALF
ncbi:MAG: DUF72 domain-containing protein [Bacteroidota bacterium]